MNNMLIPGGLFLGLGFGLAFGNVAPGLFIGLGLGMILNSLAAVIVPKGRGTVLETKDTAEK
ncbi:hypothetical protein CR205_12170 [Alteribacter lacisalsi]|uniref:Uncharacterized protein n=1 Tax=Alteribacter lacisalsi TaxID=2045244 RepID=A0A2W0HI37_9BACI|nr:hypothetical protein [Alteribacter lacisalsi]PYZ96469.1 hypothetical protein CR205_12170 [Alteribacter lacisalsi]